jgi:hypothetical protein
MAVVARAIGQIRLRAEQLDLGLAVPGAQELELMAVEHFREHRLMETLELVISVIQDVAVAQTDLRDQTTV